MKVLVTGGAGALGLAVGRELQAEHQVYLMDNEPFETEFDFIQGDILNLDDIQQAVKGMDSIIHLAELPHDVAIDIEEREQRELDFATTGIDYQSRICRRFFPQR